ncbi:hypothetical protein GQ457_11G025000 [Hibiscus cannabinus]
MFRGVSLIKKVKVEHQAPTSLLQPLKFPQWKWERITMDFVTGLPITTGKNDAVWVMVDRPTKSAHFIPVRVNMSFDILAEMYIREVILLHGVPTSIVSDRDLKFTSRFWKSLQKALNTRVSLSTAFHSQSDGQFKRVIQILEDMIRAGVIDFDRKCISTKSTRIIKREKFGNSFPKLAKITNPNSQRQGSRRKEGESWAARV